MSRSENTWHMNRMGLIDFWYYTDEEFYFSNGNMLLRGSNGSGKSVTMQSLIPLLLDGNKSSERLDPFGTRARKMENYLLDESGQRDERIGYLYLEFKKKDSELYTTIGMGIRAKKNTALDTWYFVIENNQRVNIDLHLVESGKTLTKNELKFRISDKQFISTQRQYMERVNQVLFGFENVSDYKETIDLLLRLRAPKLSNSFKPSLLNEVLSESLQPLSEDDLRDMSDSIANMDDLKAQMESLQGSIEAAGDIMRTYQKYNYAVLYDKLVSYQSAASDVKYSESKLAQDKSEEDNLVKRQEEVSAGVVQLHQEEAVLKEEEATLASSDLLRLQQEISQLSLDLETMKKRFVIKKNAEGEKDNQFIGKKNEAKKHEDELANLQMKMNQVMQELDAIFSEWAFREHPSLKNAVYENLHESYNYVHVINQLDGDLSDVSNARDLFHRLDFYEEQIKEKENEREQVKDLLSLGQSQLTKAESAYRDCIEDYKERIAKWSDNNTLVNLDEAGLRFVIGQLFAYESCRNYQPLLSFVTDIRNNLRDTISDKLSHEKIALDAIKKAQFEVEKTLVDWQNRQAIKPELSEDSAANRKYLDGLSIRYTPVYDILEFDDALPEPDVNKIEEMLLRSGLLNALLVHEKYRPIVLKSQPSQADNYIFISQPVEELDILTLTGATTIVDIFKNLGAKIDNDFAYNSDAFRMSILEGTLSGTTAAKYVGAKARENHRQKMIEQLQNELNELKGQFAESETKVKTLESDLQTIDSELSAFPAESELANCLQIVTNIETEIKDYQSKIEQISAMINTIRTDMAPIHTKIKQAADKLGIEALKPTFIDLEEHIRTYKQDLNQFIDYHNDYVRIHSLFDMVTARIDELTTEIDELRLELGDLETTISRNEEILAMKQSKIEELGIDDVRKRLDEISTRMRQIPTEIGSLERERGANETKVSHLKIAITEGVNHLAAHEERKKYYWDVIKNEIDLGLVEVGENWTIQTLSKLQSNNPIQDTLEKLNRDLFDKFHVRKGSLQAYGLTMSPFDAPAHETIHNVASRNLINAKLDGRQIGFPKLLERLSDDKETLAQILRDEDRKIFEEILISTVSKRIRDRIKNSTEWVNTMNNYISSMNTSRSSGLKLHLSWKHHTASLEGELGTKELVNLLMRDEHLLTDADKRKVSTHFRTKIEFARDTDRNEGVTASFHQIMRDVMDYRKWFTFTIYYQKTNEPRKELTNNAFSTLSGGEKAMSMYVPLFSAVAAKFASAKPDSPTIIALDEAFAGVDEKNIDAMFGLIENFGFDYIMNSQILWGDYPSVQDLAIYELHRPDNATFVTSLRYHWNGHTRTYIE